MMPDNLYLAFMLISVIAGVFFVKKKTLVAYKLLLAFITISLLNESFCFYLKTHGATTYLYYNLYYIIRFFTIGIIYTTLFSKYKKIFYAIFFLWIIVSSTIYLIVAVENGLSSMIQGVYFNLTGIFIIITGFLYLFELYQQAGEKQIFSFPFVLTTIALIFYFSTLIPFIGIFNTLKKMQSDLLVYQPIVSKSLSIVFYSVISGDFYLQWKNMKLKY